VTIDLHYMTDRQERFDLKISKLKILWKQRHLHLTSSTYLWTQHKLVFFWFRRNSKRQQLYRLRWWARTVTGRKDIVLLHSVRIGSTF